ncbi:MAG TPA: hypothetical protein ENN43_08225, partial [bacterium]|nr:hypothetical protein [bacterium]
QNIISHDKLQYYIKYIAGAVIIGAGVATAYGYINAKLSGTCGHCHGHGHGDGGKEQELNPFVVAFMAGMMPCPVTSVIIITSLGFGLVWQSLVFTAVFALGMGIAILAIAAVIWFLRERAGKLKLGGCGENNRKRAAGFERPSFYSDRHLSHCFMR